MITYRERMIHDMQLHGHSERTQESYSRAVQKLVDFYDGLPPARLSEEQVRQYFLYRMKETKWAPNTMQIAYYGIKFFFTNTLEREWNTLRLLRAGKVRKLPTVLSIDEVRMILNSELTPPNKAYLNVVYSCGLRLSEGLHLKVGDIDSKRMLVNVHLGKGAKDRYVPLPPTTLSILREYWKTHRNPVWIFPYLGHGRKQGATADRPMNTCSVQGALKREVRKIPAIKKNVSVHTLRHSYATHLLETGVNIRLVQQYLGHASLRSTMIYVHVTNFGQQDALQRINSLMTEVHA